MTAAVLRRATCVFVMLLLGGGCATGLKPAAPNETPWSVRMADSIVAQHPRPAEWERTDQGSKPKWSYATAFATYSVVTAGVSRGEGKYIDYGKSYADTFLDDDGKFKPGVYKPEDYKLDDVQAGRLLLLLNKQTGEVKYRVAADALIEQLKTQPRTADGGYWHKKTYTHEMWLDGIFMNCPFMAEYAQVAKQPQWADEAAKQILLIAQHTRDPKTGLFYHGWDESRTERWANKQTGTSPNFWGRAVGWYAMGIVETLERLPSDHPKRGEIVKLFGQLAEAVANVQDRESGVWWQVLDQGGRKGNYLESSASCMLVFALAKGVRLGVLDAKYADVVWRGYDGILKQFIRVDERGRLVLTVTCEVAGLGGEKKYRDGSYEYYLSEKRVSNDPKGVAPFILASLEMERP